MSVPDFITNILSSPYNPANIRQRSRRTKAYFALGLVCFFWGTTWLASRQGALVMPPLQLAGIRQFLGGSVYLLYFLFRGGVKWPRGREWGTIFVLGLLTFILSNGLATWGLKYITGGLAAIINAIIPLWLVIIGFFSKKSKVPRLAVTGMIIGFAGICLVFYDHLGDLFNRDFSFGIGLSLCATLAWALGTIYTKEHARYFNPYLGIGLQMLMSGMVLYGVAAISGHSVPVAAIPWQAWTAIAYLVVFGSVISYMAFLYALQHLSAEQTSLFAYINPIVAVLIGSWLFHEKLTLFIALGGVVTLLGVYLVNHSLRKQK